MEQYRYYTRTELRATADSRQVEGRVFLYGSRSVLLPDWDYGSVFEEITPGALSEDDLRSNDVVACLNHDPDQMLARSVAGKGSLQLELDDEGLLMRFEAANTLWGDYALESVRRGDFGGMSFGFLADKDTFSYTKEKDQDGKEYYVRHLDKISRLFDVSIVTHPAYPATSVKQRSVGVKEGLMAAGLLHEDAPALVRGDYDTIGAWLRRTT